MHIEFWKERWKARQIGFHLPEVNPYLTDYWSKLKAEKGSVVLVPMCGKTLDMAWLASQEYAVLGVECSHDAITEFFDDQKLTYQTAKFHEFKVHNSFNITLLEGDYFALDKEILTDVEIVYDRASLVALPAEMRRKYVKLLVEQLPSRVSILLVTIEYDQSLMSGPPFSVSHTEVEELYKPHFLVEILHEADVLNEQPRFKEKGLNKMIERVYKISC